MSVRSSRFPSVPILNLLKAKSSSAKATLVTTSEELASLESGSTKPVRVFGDNELVDSVVHHEGLADVHLLELVRSVTGFWNAPEHIASAPRVWAGFERSPFHLIEWIHFFDVPSRPDAPWCIRLSACSTAESVKPSVGDAEIGSLRKFCIHISASLARSQS